MVDTNRMFPNDAEPSEASGDSEPSQATAMPDADVMAELRRLLVVPETSEVGKIQERLENPELRAQDVGKILPAAIALRHPGNEPDPELAAALAPTLQQAFRVSVKNNPQELVDAISPVMGPAIRKAIADALQRMIQSLSQTLEHSFSPKSLKWRIEAWKTGKSFAEVVILHTLHYKVEQVFLIHRTAGLMLLHVVAPDVQSKDADMVSGMLTAIQDFARDAFSAQSGDMLTETKMGELTIWVEPDSKAIIAAAVRGVPLQELRTKLKETIEQIHQDQRELLLNFEGDTAPFEACRPALEACLLQAAKNEEPAEKKKPWVAYGVIAGVVLGIALWIFLSHHTTARENRLWADYLGQLRAIPGVMVSAPERRGSNYIISGLRDPLAAPRTDALLSEFAALKDRVETHWTPYESDAYPAQRARALLAPPPGVELGMKGKTLTLWGHAPSAWIARARLVAPLVPGVGEVETSNLIEDGMAEVRKILAPPPTVTLALDDGVLRASGVAGHGWAIKARRLGSTIPGVSYYDDVLLVDADRHAADSLKSRIESAQLSFMPGKDMLDEAGEKELRAAATATRELWALLPAASMTARIELIGRAATPADRFALAGRRIERVKGALLAAGVPETAMFTRRRFTTAPATNPVEAGASLERSVTFHLLVEDKQEPGAEGP